MPVQRKKVLFVFTSASRVLNGDPTGWYLPEACHPYYQIEPYHDIDFAATKGPDPPIDGSSVVQLYHDEEQLRFLDDPVAQKKLKECNRGPAIDLAYDKDNIRLASEFNQQGKIVGAICTDLGKKYTGFSNVEEELIGGVPGLPFLLETKFQMLGGIYVKAEKPGRSTLYMMATSYRPEPRIRS
ncbi:class I glutamine amidotransferase-like protein [Cyathus striatus]|nr:class I glutamine amidotransferase-like protein [Cyathus striatus]